MNRLIDILEHFKKNRDKELSLLGLNHFEPWPKHSDEIAGCFEPIASALIHGGHFVIEFTQGKQSHKYGIKLDKLELYYHEEVEGGHVDPIMYHTNIRLPKYLKDRGIEAYPFFNIGSFNLHISGIDITFESEGKYRASALIRAFTVFDIESQQIIAKEESDGYSTHLYDWFFPNGTSTGNMAHIHWEETLEYEISSTKTVAKDVRQNVSQYRLNDKGKYEKIPDPNSTKKGQYIQCNKKWQFARID